MALLAGFEPASTRDGPLSPTLRTREYWVVVPAPQPRSENCRRTPLIARYFHAPRDDLSPCVGLEVMCFSSGLNASPVPEDDEELANRGGPRAIRPPLRGPPKPLPSRPSALQLSQTFNGIPHAPDASDADRKLVGEASPQEP